MRYFWDFVEFITMRELGPPDAIARNYLIECDNCRKPFAPTLRDDFVRLGLHRMGFEVRGNAIAAFSELLSALRAKGLALNEVFILAYVGQFYNYHRIKTGEIKKWPKRSLKNL